MTSLPNYLPRPKLTCKWLSGLLILAALVDVARSQTIQWTRQFGSTASDSAWGVAADPTGIYVAGVTTGTMTEQASAGGYDAFVRKYDAAGTEQWTRQFGSAGSDEAHAVAVDATGAYVVGFRSIQAFVSKYDATGAEQWTRTFGDPGDVSDVAHGAAADATGVYVVGRTNGTLPGQSSGGGSVDSFVRKYSAEGEVLWTRQFGPGTDWAEAVAADASGIYVVGRTDGRLPGQTNAGQGDAYVRKYDANGNEQWTRQFGSSDFDSAQGVASDASGVYVVGYAYTALPGQTRVGGPDAFVRKYDANGNEQWTRQFGSTGTDAAKAVAVDATGIYVALEAFGTLPGQSGGFGRAYVRKYDTGGTEQWTLEVGPRNAGAPLGIAADATGVYVGGFTDVFPPATDDAFLVRITEFLPPPPPPPPIPPVSVNDGGVVNNASFASIPARVAPGSIAAVFGSNLNNGSAVLSSSFGLDGKLVTTLGGASVTINDIPAPMFYSTPGQLGIQIPFEMGGQITATIQVKVGEQVSPPRTVLLDLFAPGIFTMNQDGQGAAVVLHEDGVTLVTPENRARPNEVVAFFATGLGALTPYLPTGASSRGNATIETPAVTIGGILATTEFSGAPLGFVGLNQVNVRIPPNTGAAAEIPVVFTSGSRRSNVVTIAVGP